jgi:hypothetical protein
MRAMAAAGPVTAVLTTGPSSTTCTAATQKHCLKCFPKLLQHLQVAQGISSGCLHLQSIADSTSRPHGSAEHNTHVERFRICCMA